MIFKLTGFIIKYHKYHQEKIGDITQLLWGSGLEYRVYSKVEKILYNTVEELYPEVVDYRQEFIK